MSTAYKNIITTIVEGQVKSFIDGHPGLLDCVLWFKPCHDKRQTFINSLSKRIVFDLTSDLTIRRIKTALMDGLLSSAVESGKSSPSALGSGNGLGGHAETVAAASLELDRLLDAERLLKNAGYVVAFPHHTLSPVDGTWNYGRPRLLSMKPIPYFVVDGMVMERTDARNITDFEWFGEVPRFEPTVDHF